MAGANAHAQQQQPTGVTAGAAGAWALIAADVTAGTTGARALVAAARQAGATAASDAIAAASIAAAVTNTTATATLADQREAAFDRHASRERVSV